MLKRVSSHRISCVGESDNGRRDVFLRRGDSSVGDEEETEALREILNCLDEGSASHIEIVVRC